MIAHRTHANSYINHTAGSILYMIISKRKASQLLRTRKQVTSDGPNAVIYNVKGLPSVPERWNKRQELSLVALESDCLLKHIKAS